MSLKRFKEFTTVEDWDPKEINILVNNTQETKEVLWNSEPQVIRAGEEKPMNNWLIAHFLKHTLGLAVKPVNTENIKYDKFSEPELKEPKIAGVKDELKQVDTGTDKKVAELEAKLEQQSTLMAKLLDAKGIKTEEPEEETVLQAAEEKKPILQEAEVKPASSADIPVLCEGKTAAGANCRNSVVKGTKYCAVHSDQAK